MSITYLALATIAIPLTRRIEISMEINFTTLFNLNFQEKLYNLQGTASP